MNLNRNSLKERYNALRKEISEHPEAAFMGGLITIWGELITISARTDKPLAYVAPIVAGVVFYGISKGAGSIAEELSDYAKAYFQKPGQ